MMNSERKCTKVNAGNACAGSNTSKAYAAPNMGSGCKAANMSNAYAAPNMGNAPKAANMSNAYAAPNMGNAYATSNKDNMSRKQRMNRNQLLDWVSMLGFCRDDMLLYLDTHPTDEEALAYYEECNDLYLNAKKSFEESYGPLSIDAAEAVDGCWNWGQMPLPWEGVI